MLVAAGAEDWALFFHLLGAFSLVAGMVVAAVASEAARRRHEAREIALLLGLTRVGVVLVGIGSLLALVFGLWLVHLEHVGYGTGWVSAALALFVLMGVLGALGGRRPKEARKLAESGGDPARIRALLDDRLTIAANYLAAVDVIAIVVLMVFKPG